MLTDIQYFPQENTGRFPDRFGKNKAKDRDGRKISAACRITQEVYQRIFRLKSITGKTVEASQYNKVLTKSKIHFTPRLIQAGLKNVL